MRQKDRAARWTVKYTKAKPSADGAPRVDLAIPAFGYKNHIGIDRRHGLIRTRTTTDASRHDGAVLPDLIDRDNTARDVWADTAYCSKAMRGISPTASCVRDRSQEAEGQADAATYRPRQQSKVQGARRVEHVFARQKGPMGLYIRTIGIARAKTKIGVANIVYNMKRILWLTAHIAPA